MKPRKPKATGPSLRDRLSANFLRAFEADFAVNGVNVIEALRQKSPDKYADIAAKLIAQAEPPPDPNDLSQCKSLEDIGRALLRGVGMADDEISDEMVAAAMKANDHLMDTLESIAATFGTRDYQ
jgi:hypothetical protein